MATQLVFINSENRVSGTPYEFHINFNNDLLKSKKGSFMRLTVEECTINRSWYSIQNGQNSFNVVSSSGSTQTVTFEPAYYNAIDLRTKLSELLVGWTVTYDRKTNKFTFTRPNNGVTWYMFTFSDGLSEILGFNQTEQPIFTLSTLTLQSTKPIRINDENAVCIHTDLGRSKNSAIDNHNYMYKSFKESTLLCKIPIECAPFDNIVYNVQSPVFVYDLTAPNITNVRVWVTDENDRVLQLPYDWSMTWKIEHLPLGNTRNPLEDVRDYLKLMVLSDKKILSS